MPKSRYKTNCHTSLFTKHEIAKQTKLTDAIKGKAIKNNAFNAGLILLLNSSFGFTKYRILSLIFITEHIE